MLMQGGTQQQTVGTLGDALVQRVNRELISASVRERICWGLEHFNERVVLASSFGIQSAVCLHMITREIADIPVILIDTGYLFPETYQFVDQMVERLKLNLKVYRPELSSAWQEARYGKLWEQGLSGIERYNSINKVEPMQRALKECGADAWFSGIRRKQSSSRARIDPIMLQNGRVKIHPIFDWTDRDVFRYLKAYDLPYHPLWDLGYLSVGDVHTSRPAIHDDISAENSRFFGLTRECGLHTVA